MGLEAMKKMAGSVVFISGMSGLGVETAKNVALAGVKKLIIHDTTKTSYLDLSTQFYLTESDIGRNRAEVCGPKLNELNRYTPVEWRTEDLESIELSYFDGFSLVCLIGASLGLQTKVNNYCRQKKIRFIAGSTAGIFGSLFTDFGIDFQIMDPNGEELKEMMIRSITVHSPTELRIHCLHNERHGLETGNYIKFTEQKQCPELEGKTYQITDVDPNCFSIQVDTTPFKTMDCSGLASEVRGDILKTYNSLKVELQNPTLTNQIHDFSKFGSGYELLVALKALDSFVSLHKDLPKQWDIEDAQKLISLAKDTNEKSENKVDLNEDVLKMISFTSRGQFAGLTAFLGGLAAQQVLIGVTGKFTPLNQWVFVDIRELVGSVTEFDAANYAPTNSRLDAQRMIIGNEACKKLAESKLFMIGCGAIGCEMMKNYAMLGFGTSEGSLISVTDNDLIEKSNLNRQFLFRAKDIDQPKSLTASKAVLSMNPDLKVQAFTTKAGKESEDKFTNEFFQTQNVIVNALDNLEARLYVDSRCVENGKPLLESGTQGAKGHVQVILPFLTPNYGSDVDPPEDGFAYCTVKSFPGKIVHTIQWARERFNKNFQDIPSETSQFRIDSQKDGYWERFLKADPKPNKVDMQKYAKLLSLQVETLSKEC